MDYAARASGNLFHFSQLLFERWDYSSLMSHITFRNDFVTRITEWVVAPNKQEIEIRGSLTPTTGEPIAYTTFFFPFSISEMWSPQTARKLIKCVANGNERGVGHFLYWGAYVGVKAVSNFHSRRGYYHLSPERVLSGYKAMHSPDSPPASRIWSWGELISNPYCALWSLNSAVDWSCLLTADLISASGIPRDALLCTAPFAAVEYLPLYPDHIWGASLARVHRLFSAHRDLVHHMSQRIASARYKVTALQKISWCVLFDVARMWMLWMGRGQTPLYFAWKYASPDVQQLLLENGADWTAILTIYDDILRMETENLVCEGLMTKNANWYGLRYKISTDPVFIHLQRSSRLVLKFSYFR